MFTNDQVQAIEHNEGPMMVIGTPGSGKTTVITNRINYLINEHGVNPAGILVITFTKAAALSMKHRFLELAGEEFTKVRFGTFHSFFYWIIRTAYGDRGVLDEMGKRNILRKILQEIDRDTYDNDETLSSVVNQLGIMSSDMIDIENYYSRDMSEKDFEKLYHAYDNYKKTNGLLDFDDMVTECYKLLSQRSDILDLIRDMYPYIMVDEYQDTNRIQYEILRMLSHPRDNIYVVGDDDQSIYGFRGARPDIMLQFEKEFPGTKIVHLSYNFRCPGQIVDISSRIISGNSKRYNKKLQSAVAEKGIITIDKVKDSSDQTNLIVKRLRSMDISELQDVAVLYRTNIEPRRLIYKLREYSIPFTVRDSLPDIFTHPYVKPVIDYISYALGDHSRKIFLNIMNKPLRYISRDMLRREEVELKDLLVEARGKEYLISSIRNMHLDMINISRLTPYAAVNYIRQAVGYDAYLKSLSEERNMDLEELVSILDEFQSLTRECETFGDLYDMIEDSRELLKKKSEENSISPPDDSDKGVQLMTIHSAKGLEFKVVHIIDLYEGAIPHKKSKSQADLEEERRLLYVGVTRSKEKLHLYVPQRKGDEAVEPSRFIKNLK
ncbi:MAG: ATP-dependent helicase [Eubacterium sp.]|nr:ATP-dependent helicase [Eubacterium sp.]